MRSATELLQCCKSCANPERKVQDRHRVSIFQVCLEPAVWCMVTQVDEKPPLLPHGTPQLCLCVKYPSH